MLHNFTCEKHNDSLYCKEIFVYNVLIKHWSLTNINALVSLYSHYAGQLYLIDCMLEKFNYSGTFLPM